MKLVILTPSRGRPEGFAAMVQAVRSTAARPENISILLATDDDDVAYPELEGVTHLHGPRQRLAQWTNQLASHALEDDADILAFLGDDHRPRTHGWDLMVAGAFVQMGSGLVYCADGLQNERLPTAPFWSADIIRALGFFYPPNQVHLYADDYWLRLARDLGRCSYLRGVLIEHCHPSAGKAIYDDTYRENDTWYDHDFKAFHQFLADGHPAALARVQEALCVS
jgi:hypothetical protein